MECQYCSRGGTTPSSPTPPNSQDSPQSSGAKRANQFSQAKNSTQLRQSRRLIRQIINKATQPLKTEGEASLGDLLNTLLEFNNNKSSQPQGEHPLCCGNCVDLCRSALELRLTGLKKERAAYDKFLNNTTKSNSNSNSKQTKQSKPTTSQQALLEEKKVLTSQLMKLEKQKTVLLEKHKLKIEKLPTVTTEDEIEQLRAALDHQQFSLEISLDELGKQHANDDVWGGGGGFIGCILLPDLMGDLGNGNGNGNENREGKLAIRLKDKFNEGGGGSWGEGEIPIWLNLLLLYIGNLVDFPWEKGEGVPNFALRTKTTGNGWWEMLSKLRRWIGLSVPTGGWGGWNDGGGDGGNVVVWEGLAQLILFAEEEYF
ncbi:hypothetical protein ScalyP_jg9380 [Parmales sp. scaly parma]|nr:hypothetical protein ScalyP_jg9380 [Parmales sp. scaly parma]